MRVLSVIHSAAYGGPHNQALQLQRAVASGHVASKHLASGPAGDGLELTVVVPDEPGEAADRLRDAGVDVVVLPLVRPRALRSGQGPVELLRRYPGQVSDLCRLIRARDVDVVEVHGLLNVDGALAARVTGRALVWQLVDTRPPPSLRRAATPAVVALADVVMTTGERVADQYPGARWRPRHLRTFVPPVGVEPPADPGPARARARRALGVPDDAPLVVSIGNLNPQKGHDALIAAVAARRPAAPKVVLRIRGATHAGHEAYAEGLAGQAEQAGFGPDAVGPFPPGLGVTDLLAAADIFALAAAGRSEGIPTVMLEAMTLSVPVLVTDVGGVRDVVTSGTDGVVVPPDRPDRLEDELGRLLADADWRRRLGTAGAATAARLASPEAFAQVQLDAYRAAVAFRSARAR